MLPLPSFGKGCLATLARFMAFRRLLIISGDDLGYNEEKDKGIFECFLDRSITNASILANGASSCDAARDAQKIGLPVGLHFNITEGKPLNKRVNSLVGNNGLFLGKLESLRAIKDNVFIEEEVEMELISQIEWYKHHFRCLPYHVDGHQHIHVMPMIRDVFSRTLEDYGIRWTRLPVEKNINQRDVPKQKREFFKCVIDESRRCIPLFKSRNIFHTTNFIGLSSMGKNMTQHLLDDLLEEAFNDKNGVISCELMAHPGYRCEGYGGCGGGPDDFSKSEDREHEMKILRSKLLKQCYREKNIELVSYKGLDDVLRSL